MAATKKSVSKTTGASDDPIIQDGEPVLREHAKTLTQKEIASPEIQKLIAKMKKLLAKEKHGVGLAAPQVGSAVRLFIIAGRVFAPEIENEDEESKKVPPPPDRVFINPTIIRRSKSVSEMSEGCLSVRGLYGAVIRHDKATIKALDENGKPFSLNGSGLLAQIFQHEVDHLDGVLYIDKATALRPEKID